MTRTTFYLFNGFRLEYDDHVREVLKALATDEPETSETPLDAVMADIRREIVRPAIRKDMEDHRDVYDALADE